MPHERHIEDERKDMRIRNFSLESPREIAHMQVEAHAQVCAAGAGITVALWLSAHAMDQQPTGLSVPAFTAPTLPIVLGVVYRRDRHAGQAGSRI